MSTRQSGCGAWPRSLWAQVGLIMVGVAFALVASATASSGASSPARPALSWSAEDDVPPYGTAPPKGDPGVPKCPWGRAPYLASDPQTGGPNLPPVCGSDKDDGLRVLDQGGGKDGGSRVSAGPGNDFIDVARNGGIDEIWGGQHRGTGHDTARIDSCLGGSVHDTVHDIPNKDWIKRVSTGCGGYRRSPSNLRLDSSTPPPHSVGYVTCGIFGDRRGVQIAPQPTMRAADVTPNVDWQTVAYQALLFKSNDDGQTWVPYRKSPWLVDRTFDQQVINFPGNYWHDLAGTRRFTLLPVDEPGKYRVAVHFHWYATNSALAFEATEWSAYHFGAFHGTDYHSCDFPGPPLRTGQYAGSTDEHKSISLDVEPWILSPTPALTWSYVKTLVFTSSVVCPQATAPIDWTITRPYITIRSDGTFSDSFTGPLPATGAQNLATTFFVSGKVDPSGNASGLLQIAQISYDQSGRHYDCTGAPHTWSARAGP